MPTKSEAAGHTRAPLSRDRVVEAAVKIADETGIESLSMRKLAQALGVEAMSLYHYVRKKDEILDNMLDVVYSEVEVPAGGDWRSAMRTSAISMHDALLRHPWAPGLTMSPSTRVSEPRLRHMNAVLGRLREAGFTDTLTDHAYHALDSYIIGFTLWQLPIIALTKDLPALARQFYDQIPDDMPHLRAHIEYHMAPPSSKENAFEFGLDLILDGLERRRDVG